jgi:hypothetical protein
MNRVESKLSLVNPPLLPAYRIDYGIDRDALK